MNYKGKRNIILASIAVIVASLFLLQEFVLKPNDSSKEAEAANLGFEKAGSNGMPAGWTAQQVLYRAFRDSSTYATGKYSLCMESTDTDSTPLHYCKSVRSFALDYAVGATMRFSAWIKADRLEHGTVNLLVHFLRGDSVVCAKSFADSTIIGTTAWKRYSFEFTIPPEAEKGTYGKISYGMLVAGSGSVWFDDLSLELNGQPFTNHLEYRHSG